MPEPIVTLKLEGAEVLQKALSDPKMVKGPIRKFLEKAGHTVEARAKEKAPVDTGRLRASIATEVEEAQARVGSKVKYACIIGARHSVYDPISRKVGGIGHYPYAQVLSKDGLPHRIVRRLSFYQEEIEGIAIRTRLGRHPLWVTSDHLILIWRDGRVFWEPARQLRESDYIFGKRSHNAITNGTNKVSYLCFCGTIFQVDKYMLHFRQPKYCSPECRQNYGPHDMAKGKHWELSEGTKERYRGLYNSQWRDGSAMKPYDYNFNGKLKTRILERDGFQCQLCFSPFHLVVHHRDWDKMNSASQNLLTLCRSCHGHLQRQDCELVEVNQIAFVPKAILGLERREIRRQGKLNMPRLYDFTVHEENSFVVSGMLVHNSFVEFGTRPHFPPLSAMQPWARRHGFPGGSVGAFLVARAIAQRGTKPQPYLIPALTESKGDIDRLLAEASAEIESKWGKK